MYSLSKIIFLMLLMPALSEAKEKKCPEPKDFQEKIYNCGQNILAKKYAKSCADETLATARLAGAATGLVMNELNKNLSSNQNNATLDALVRLDVAVDKLGAMIPFLQKRTDLIASYPTVMIDYPNSKNDDESMDCFSESFNEIQKIVNEMDNEIISMKKAFKEAESMAMKISETQTGLGSFSHNATVESKSDGSVPIAPKASKKTKKQSSDISGTEEEENK